MMQVLFRIPILTRWPVDRAGMPYFPDGVPIYGFGVMLFLAFVLCTWLAGRRGEREGIKKDTIQDLAIWIFIGGLLGARITYLVQQEKVQSLFELVKRLPQIWEGGIVLYGAFLGGLAGYALAYALVFRKQGLSTRRLSDAIAPSIALGVCLGRMGCFLNGCCYGQVACAACAGVCPVYFPLSAPPRAMMVEQGWQTAAGFTVAPPPTDGKVGARVALVNPHSAAGRAGLQAGDVIVEANDHPVRGNGDLDAVLSPGQWPRGQSRLTLTYTRGDDDPATITIVPRSLGLYPTQLYEVVSMALLFLVLLAYEPFRRNPGQVMAVLMVGYGLHRYLNEILRDDPRPQGLESYGSIVCVVAGAALWVWLWRKAPDPPVTPVGDAARPTTRPTPA
jgi:prolipoprotein diacylglyceryltransferase